MNMRDYPTLHWDTNLKEQLVVRKYMDVNEHERLSNITLRHKFKQGNMRDYPTLHLDTNSSKGTTFPLLIYISVTIGSYIYSITHTLKWVWNQCTYDDKKKSRFRSLT